MPKADVADPVLAGCLRAGCEADVYALLGPSVDGLNAGEVGLRLAEHGPNTLARPPRPALARRFLANFAHLMAILLWIGGAAAWLDWLPDLAIAIWAVVIINGLFSFWQEYKAVRSTEALLQYLPRQARVMRHRPRLGQIPHMAAPIHSPRIWDPKRREKGWFRGRGDFWCQGRRTCPHPYSRAWFF